MKRVQVFMTFFLLISSVSAYSQQIDSLITFKNDSINFDSLNKYLDLNKVFVQNVKDKIASKSDSLKLNRAIHQAGRKLDSLNLSQQSDRVDKSIDSIRLRLTSKINSLTSPALVDSSVHKNIANLQLHLDSVKSGGMMEDLRKGQGKIDNLQSQVNEKTKSVGGSVNEKLGLFNNEGADINQLNLPEVNTQSLNLDTSLPDLNTNLQDVSLPNIAPDINVPETSSLADVPKLNVGLDKLDVPGKENLSGLSGNLGKSEEFVDQMKGYQQDVKNINTGDLDEMKQVPETLESKLESMSEVAGVKEQIETVPDYKAMIQKWNSDPEVAKEMALAKAKQVAVNHFAGHEEELKAAMEQLSKLKSKIPDPEGVVDLFAKYKSSLKEKKFVERLVPGLSMQFQKNGSFWLDLNPYLAYKISGRFTAGIGWNERIAYDFDEMDWDAENHVYGMRTFVHFKLKANFWLKSEVESMRSPVRATPTSNDVIGRAWVISYFGGIKKDFQLSKRFRGNVQVLYNLYNPEKASPYVNRLNVRMGLELPLKKRPVKDPKTTQGS